MDEDTVTLDQALQDIPNRLHPGAERYYREIGLTVPEPIHYEPKGRPRATRRSRPGGRADFPETT